MYIYINSNNYDKISKVFTQLVKSGIEYNIISEKSIIANAKVKKTVQDLLLTEVPYSDFNFKDYHIKRFKEIISDDDMLDSFKGLAITMLISDPKFDYLLDDEIARVFRVILELDEKEFQEFV